MDGANSDLDYSAGVERQVNQTIEAEDRLEPPKDKRRPRKTLSKAERERRHKVRLANQFPNGPEAKELASDVTP